MNKNAFIVKRFVTVTYYAYLFTVLFTTTLVIYYINLCSFISSFLQVGCFLFVVLFVKSGTCRSKIVLKLFEINFSMAFKSDISVAKPQLTCQTNRPSCLTLHSHQTQNSLIPVLSISNCLLASLLNSLYCKIQSCDLLIFSLNDL